MYRQPSHRDMNKAHALLFALMMMTVSLAGYFLGGDEDSTNEDIELKDEIQLLSAVLEQNWDIVDHNSGRLCSLALDATGNVHVSYYSQDQIDIYFVSSIYQMVHFVQNFLMFLIVFHIQIH